MNWEILRAGTMDEVLALIEQELVDRVVVAMFHPPSERLRLGGVDYRPAQPGEPVDLWLSLPLEGLVRQAFVKETP